VSPPVVTLACRVCCCCFWVVCDGPCCCCCAGHLLWFGTNRRTVQHSGSSRGMPWQACANSSTTLSTAPPPHMLTVLSPTLKPLVNAPQSLIRYMNALPRISCSSSHSCCSSGLCMVHKYFAIDTFCHTTMALFTRVEPGEPRSLWSPAVVCTTHSYARVAARSPSCRCTAYQYSVRSHQAALQQIAGIQGLLAGWRASNSIHAMP
jgi:hypothetical protein